MAENNEDTIAGLGTAPGKSEVGIVRISGPDAIAFFKCHFSPNGKTDISGSFHFYDGMVTVSASCLQVPCRAYMMRAPHSYTREDVIELHIPGSPVLIEMLLSFCYECGLRMPEAGEFTKRAFLNGRIGLIQAMGVREIISASDKQQLAAAHNMLLGGIAEKFGVIQDMLEDLLCMVELQIDFSQEDISAFKNEQDFVKRIDRIIDTVAAMREARPVNRTISGESHVIIGGMVNAGKSTLFNVLLDTDRSSVSPVPGTTRDILRAETTIRGKPFIFYDSPGFSTIPGIFERKAREIIQKISLDGMFMLLLIDPEMEIPDNLLDQFLQKPGPARTLAVGTKDDLELDNAGLKNSRISECLGLVRVSVYNEDSIEILKEHLMKMTDIQGMEGGGYTESMFDYYLKKTLAILERVRKSGNSYQDSPELVAEELREVLSLVGHFNTGHPEEDVLNRIFSRFCIGK